MKRLAPLELLERLKNGRRMACACERFLLQIDFCRKKAISERLNDAFCAIFG
jgi:hypothetical protein